MATNKLSVVSLLFMRTNQIWTSIGAVSNKKQEYFVLSEFQQSEMIIDYNLLGVVIPKK